MTYCFSGEEAHKSRQQKSPLVRLTLYRHRTLQIGDRNGRFGEQMAEKLAIDEVGEGPFQDAGNPKNEARI